MTFSGVARFNITSCESDETNHDIANWTFCSSDKRTFKTMAVLKSVRGIQVTVRVDGKALEEYEDDEFEAVPGEVGDYQASRTVAKYIESCTGKNFDMKFKVDEEYKFDSPNITFSTYVDGTKVHTRIVARNNSFPR